MERPEIEQNIFGFYGMDHATLYDNAHGREKAIVSNVRYVYWYIIHYENNVSVNRISREFFRTPRIIYKGISNVKYRIRYDKYYQDIYKNLKESTR